MDPIFQKALQFTLQFEGGYVNHPADPGGATNKGVTQLVYNSWRHDNNLPMQTVKKITQAEVEQIYYTNYWLKFGCNQLPEKLGIAVFDFCVNAGRRGTIKLQQVLGISDDGILGKGSFKAINDYIKTNGEIKLLVAYIEKRDEYYRAIGKGKLSVFLKGWLNRTKGLRTFLGL